VSITLVIRSGTPDCDWVHRFSELSDEQLKLWLLGVQEALYAACRSGYDSADEIELGALDADAHQDIETRTRSWNWSTTFD